MTDTKRLFDKSPDELREAFVRNRFGQADVFGFTDIEPWLAHQRNAERPDDPRWTPFFARHVVAMCVSAPIQHLRERATTMSSEEAMRAGAFGYGPMYSLLCDNLYGGTRGPRALVQTGSNTVFVLGEEEHALIVNRLGNRNEPHGAGAVLDILFAEWNRQRPKWREARQFLCDALAKDIARERDKAEHDFDAAVAVSNDGTKIVCADWVVVVEQSERFTLFPAAAFRTRKARRPDDRLFRRSSSHRVFVEGMTNVQKVGQIAITEWKHGLAWIRHYIWGMLPGTAWAIFCDYALDPNSGKSGQQRIYVTSAPLCPSPLPDGGVAVTA